MTAQQDLPGSVLAAVSREMVRLKAEHYGKGAVEAKTYACDDWLFCVMKGGMTAVEENLIAHDDADLVRTVRLRFQSNMEENFRESVERVTGRPVLAYQSQVIFHPHFVVEIFLLGASD